MSMTSMQETGRSNLESGKTPSSAVFEFVSGVKYPAWEVLRDYTKDRSSATTSSSSTDKMQSARRLKQDLEKKRDDEADAKKNRFATFDKEIKLFSELSRKSDLAKH